ncbi:MAG TPA: ferredoxin [Euryarchaeota archaeon]|nr:ferredoxin [Euryarchaeota archaeon]HIQ10030.1 ferredoxin [Euryarchaeota archaeon]
MKVRVDRDTCIGCGVCVALAPEYFKLDSEGKSVAVKEEVAPEDEEKVRNAASSCPTQAIKTE